MTGAIMELTDSWKPIVSIDRNVEMPEDPTLHRAAIWWSVYSGLEDGVVSRAWATLVAEQWEYARERVSALTSDVWWLRRTTAQLRENAAVARIGCDATMMERPDAFEDADARAPKSSDRLARYLISMQQLGVSLMIESGQISSDLVTSRLGDPYVAGYLSGLAASVCDSIEVASDDPRCSRARLEVVRSMFGDDVDEVAAAIFFALCGTATQGAEGMVHAHEDLRSFRRWQRGESVRANMGLVTYLTA